MRFHGLLELEQLGVRRLEHLGFWRLELHCVFWFDPHFWGGFIYIKFLLY